MKSTKDIIRENLIALRKSNNLTQQQLAEIIGYNDKAISRWESGIVFPDLDVIDTLCNFYKVSFNYLIESHTKLKYSPKKKRRAIIILLCCIQTLWILTVISFLGFLIYTPDHKNIWPVFILATSLTFVLLQIYNFIMHRNRALTIVYFSLIIWTSLAFFYCTFLHANLWMLFIAGVPLESGLFLYHYSQETK